MRVDKLPLENILDLNFKIVDLLKIENLKKLKIRNKKSSNLKYKFTKINFTLHKFPLFN